MRLAAYFHCLWFAGDPPRPLPAANRIILEQMSILRNSGLLDALDRFVVGVNGSAESESKVKLCIPTKAQVVYHGLDSRSENLTLVERDNWVRSLPALDDWAVLYFHSKSITHVVGSDYARFAGKWKDCMMEHCVNQWTTCVMDLIAGYEAVGCHWMTKLGHDHSQSIFAGNCFWAKASFLRTVPSMFTRTRIKEDGIGSASSRFEAEVHIGNGPRLPIVKDYCTRGLMVCSA